MWLGSQGQVPVLCAHSACFWGVQLGDGCVPWEFLLYYGRRSLTQRHSQGVGLARATRLSFSHYSTGIARQQLGSRTFKRQAPRSPMKYSLAMV